MSDEKRDPPITPPMGAFVGGVNVVDIGDYRVARGLARRERAGCPHVHVVYDENERRIWCSDCERDVEPFDAFRNLVTGYHYALDRVRRREKELSEAETFQARARATKALDEVWRSRNYVPACPSCGDGLLPEDFANGRFVRLGRDYAAARKKRAAEGREE